MSFTITCPVCGRRDLYEFRFGGEERVPRPEEAGLTPEAWSDWIHGRENPRPCLGFSQDKIKLTTSPVKTISYCALCLVGKSTCHSP